MDPRCRALADAIGMRIVAGDLEGLRALLAPWLQDEMTEARLAEMIAAASDGLPAPAAWTVDEGLADLETLRVPDGLSPPTRPFPAEITPANFRGWLCVQFQPDPDDTEEHNACFDLWLAAVMHEDSCRAGYLESAEAT